MARKIFVNLPVKNLDKSKEFFKKLSFSFNPQFSDETAACLVISPDIYAMLLNHKKFKGFTKREIPDPQKASEVILTISVDSKDQVDQLLEKVLLTGGREPSEPDVYDFMYGRSFEDPDGHLWEVFWMDPNKKTK